jgi:hypothetical protein
LTNQSNVVGKNRYIVITTSKDRTGVMESGRVLRPYGIIEKAVVIHLLNGIFLNLIYLTNSGDDEVVTFLVVVMIILPTVSILCLVSYNYVGCGFCRWSSHTFVICDIL